MPSLHNDIFDNGLFILTNDTVALHITSQEPTTYAEATVTYKLGTKAAPVVGAPVDRPLGGRQVTISNFADGLVEATGLATFWALVATGPNRLLATGQIGNPQSVTAGNPFQFQDIAIGLPDPIVVP